jgi:hypothetical protein
MWCEANERFVAMRLPAVALLAAAVMISASRGLSAETRPAGAADSSVSSQDASDNAPGGASTDTHEARLKKQRRDAVRKVAVVSLFIILVLIVFVVTLMIVTRRLRVRYLGWDRGIKFGKIWDVWWQKPEPPKPGEKDKPAER